MTARKLQNMSSLTTSLSLKNIQKMSPAEYSILMMILVICLMIAMGMMAMYMRMLQQRRMIKARVF